MSATSFGTSYLLLGVVAPLIAVPLTFITLYLRSLREHQLTKHRELAHRIERVEEALSRHTAAISQMERDFTTKEEWLRETTHARHRLERLVEAVVRIETTLFDESRSEPTGRHSRGAVPTGPHGPGRRTADADEPGGGL